MINVNLFAINTQSYSKISELKIWPKSGDIYLSSKENHQCSNTTHKTRFILKDNSYNEKYISFALIAFTANKEVSLYYICDNSGYPVVKGIRLKN